MKCPYCGCQRFYVKDSEDEYATYGFDCEAGDVCFDPEIDPDQQPDLADDTRIFCNQCAWNGQFHEIKNS